jgi:hypothetical protein
MIVLDLEVRIRFTYNDGRDLPVPLSQSCLLALFSRARSDDIYIWPSRNSFVAKRENLWVKDPTEACSPRDDVLALHADASTTFTSTFVLFPSRFSFATLAIWLQSTSRTGPKRNNIVDDCIRSLPLYFVTQYIHPTRGVDSSRFHEPA